MKRMLTVCVVLLLVPWFEAYAQDSDVILGTWLTAEGKSHVQVYKCGNSFCGKIVWLKEPLDESGKPKVDKDNPDESLRSRPVMGLKIMTDLVFDKKNRKGQYEYKDGQIYDPKKGKTYKCTAKIDGKMMYFRGYWGPVYRASQWKRVK